MKRGLLFAFTTFLILGANAQDNVTYNKRNIKVNKINTYSPRTATPIFAPKLENLEAPSPDGDSYRSFLQRQKVASDKQFPRKTMGSIARSSAAAQDPYINEGLMMYRKANWPTGDSNFVFGGGNPLDNTMAVSMMEF